MLSLLGRYRDDAWDEAVLARTRRCVADSLGCYVAGLGLLYFKRSVTGMKASLLPSGKDRLGLSPLMMAYIYGQAANALDYDDTLYGHLGGSIVAAVLSVAISNKLSLDRFLRGVAAGYDASTFLSFATSPSEERGAKVRSVSNVDIMARSLGVVVALGLNDNLMERIIGIAVGHTVIPYVGKCYERPVPGIKNNMGWTAVGAVILLALAQAGQTGINNSLDGDNGFWLMVGSDH